MSNLTNTALAEMKAEYLQENQGYHNQLRKVWLHLVKDYPDYYTDQDYFKACKNIGIPVF